MPEGIATFNLDRCACGVNVLSQSIEAWHLGDE
jgi:hypothetical protein